MKNEQPSSESSPTENYVIGPNGEKRPACEVANAIHVMKMATGLAEEEYVEDAPKKKPKEKDD
ncbi:MAG: hypothetical protein F4W92_01610 [Gammaproteobacteria bacterium]|nr:hypothetical protein [Gammaproteobacteria bacterium]